MTVRAPIRAFCASRLHWRMSREALGTELFFDNALLSRFWIQVRPNLINTTTPHITHKNQEKYKGMMLGSGASLRSGTEYSCPNCSSSDWVM